MENAGNRVGGSGNGEGGEKKGEEGEVPIKLSESEAAVQGNRIFTMDQPEFIAFLDHQAYTRSLKADRQTDADRKIPKLMAPQLMPFLDSSRDAFPRTPHLMGLALRLTGMQCALDG